MNCGILAYKCKIITKIIPKYLLQVEKKKIKIKNSIKINLFNLLSLV